MNSLPHDDFDPPDGTPRDAFPSIAALDRILNRRIACSRSPADIDRWLSLKHELKRGLTALPAAFVEPAAGAVFRELLASEVLDDGQ